MNRSHDASGQMAGYLYQILAALLLLLKSQDNNAQVCIEKFDDVAFVENDIPQIMIQTKHQITKRGSLTNTSVDLWRTLKSWCDTAKNFNLDINSTLFTIITTAEAQQNSIAYYLSHTASRNTDEAIELLRSTASTPSVQVNKIFYDTFLSLPADIQDRLVSKIYIYDKSSNIINIKNDIMVHVRWATLPEFEERVYERVVGWWIKSVIECLCSSEPIFISRFQLQSILNDIGSEYKADSLPIDIDPFREPTEEELDEIEPGNKIFIDQLKLLSLSHEKLKRCIRDYYNAFQQRSKWVREQLLYIDELARYESLLIDEWNRLYCLMKEDLEEYGEQIEERHKISAGRKLFNNIEELNLNIREKVTMPFIMRGTYHELSNQFKVGWHVDFMERLCYLLRR
jgi:hypothetical protein